MTSPGFCSFTRRPTPRLTPPSSAPTGLHVVVNGTASITVSFDAVTVLPADPSAPASAYRLDFRQTLGGPIVGTVTTASTVTVVPLPPGTVGTFNVTATAINGAGAGPTSEPVSFTIGPPPCTGPPDTPMVSGSFVAGTLTLTWPQVPGATAYIVSAGISLGSDESVSGDVHRPLQRGDRDRSAAGLDGMGSRERRQRVRTERAGLHLYQLGRQVMAADTGHRRGAVFSTAHFRRLGRA